MCPVIFSLRNQTVRTNMLTEIPFSFPGKIFRSPMPFSQFDNSDTWEAFRENEVEIVVVLTEQAEYLVYAGRDLLDFYKTHGIESIPIPVPDFGIPLDLDAWEAGLEKVAQAAKNGKRVAIHCLAGIGRTGTFLACLAKRELGLEGWDAIQWVRKSLPGAMENKYQEHFVVEY
jgi:atypical dual specificity phosphatase